MPVPIGHRVPCCPTIRSRDVSSGAPDDSQRWSGGEASAPGTQDPKSSETTTGTPERAAAVQASDWFHVTP